jgi:hypothetical protein
VRRVLIALAFAVRMSVYDRSQMTDSHSAEIEKTLLYISEARKRAAKTVKSLRAEGADDHLVEALENTERELEALGRKLMQQTYFAVPRDQLSFAPVQELTHS